jgi:TonB family protein
VNRADAVSALCAVIAHLGFAIALAYAPSRLSKGPSVVEFEVRKPKPPPEAPKLTQPEPPKPPPPPPPPLVRKVVMQKRDVPPPTPAPPPPPNVTQPKEPPKEPPRPVFGINMESTTEGDSSFAVPVGNTTMIDPSKSAKHSGPVAPLASAPAAPAAPEYKPVSPLYVKEEPSVDADACGRMVAYPDEAVQQGIEGVVKLRIALDEKGHVHDIKVLEGLGHGVDQAVVYAIRNKCRFTPAIATDGKPVAYVISPYNFRFELNR